MHALGLHKVVAQLDRCIKEIEWRHLVGRVVVVVVVTAVVVAVLCFGRSRTASGFALGLTF